MLPLFREKCKKALKYYSEKGLTNTLRRVTNYIVYKMDGTPAVEAKELTSLINLGHPHIISQFQAIWHLMANMEKLVEKRKEVQRMRKVPDVEIFQRFPPWVVATYPGDTHVFGSAWFLDMLPKEIPFRFASLGEVHGDP